MSRVPLIDAQDTQHPSQPILAEIKQAFGGAPHMFRAVANSPAALRSLWGAFGALGGGRLPARLTEQLAVAVANRNGCEYCLAAHTALGRKAGASSAEMAQAQLGGSDDPATAAALAFALAVVERRGRVSAAELETVRAAGFDDGQIVEILAHVALNLFTNYVNNALETPLDFPAVALKHAA